MALGVVPVVIDYGGPGELVVPGTGFKVPIDDPDVVIMALRKQFQDIAADPSVLPKLGVAAQARAGPIHTACESPSNRLSLRLGFGSYTDQTRSSRGAGNSIDYS